jgi:hypothetical protein
MSSWRISWNKIVKVVCHELTCRLCCRRYVCPTIKMSVMAIELSVGALDRRLFCSEIDQFPRVRCG